MIMATNARLILHLRANTRWVMPVAWSLYPLVWLGLISVERVVAIAMQFARVEVVSEGWGRD